MERKNKIRHLFDIILTVLLILVVLCGIVWFADRFGMISLDSIFYGETLPTELTNDYGRIEDALADFESKKETYDRFEVSLDNAKQTLGEISMPDTMYWEAQITVLDGDKERVTDFKVYKSFENYRIDISGTQYKTVIHNGSATYIRNNLTSQSRIIEKDSDFSFLDQINIAGLDSLLKNDDNRIMDVYIMNINNVDCMYVEYTNERLDKYDRYFVSLEFGCVVDAVSRLGDDTVYRLETINIVRAPDIKDSYFSIPKT